MRAAMSWGVSQDIWECAADVSASSAVRRTSRSLLSTAAITEGNVDATAGLQWGERRARLQAAAAQRARALVPEAEASCVGVQMFDALFWFLWLCEARAP